MSDPFDIQRIRPTTAEGVLRTSKKNTGIQKQDIATESSPDKIRRREEKNREKGNHQERTTQDTHQDSEADPAEGVIDIII